MQSSFFSHVATVMVFPYLNRGLLVYSFYQRGGREKGHVSSPQLFETLGLEVSEGIVFDGIADLERVAADLTVFDVGMAVNREIQDHRNLSPAKGTGEGVFHGASTGPRANARPLTLR